MNRTREEIGSGRGRASQDSMFIERRAVSLDSLLRKENRRSVIGIYALTSFCIPTGFVLNFVFPPIVITLRSLLNQDEIPVLLNLLYILLLLAVLVAELVLYIRFVRALSKIRTLDEQIGFFRDRSTARDITLTCTWFPLLSVLIPIVINLFVTADSSYLPKAVAALVCMVIITPIVVGALVRMRIFGLVPAMNYIASGNRGYGYRSPSFLIGESVLHLPSLEDRFYFRSVDKQRFKRVKDEVSVHSLLKKERTYGRPASDNYLGDRRWI